MVKAPDRRSKLAPKFVGQRQVVSHIQPHRYELFDKWLNAIEVVHGDRIKKINWCQNQPRFSYYC